MWWWICESYPSGTRQNAPFVLCERSIIMGHPNHVLSISYEGWYHWTEKNTFLRLQQSFICGGVLCRMDWKRHWSIHSLIWYNVSLYLSRACFVPAGMQQGIAVKCRFVESDDLCFVWSCFFFPQRIRMAFDCLHDLLSIILFLEPAPPLSLDIYPILTSSF